MPQRENMVAWSSFFVTSEKGEEKKNRCSGEGKEGSIERRGRERDTKNGTKEWAKGRVGREKKNVVSKGGPFSCAPPFLGARTRPWAMFVLSDTLVQKGKGGHCFPG